VASCCIVSAQETTGRIHTVVISGGMNKMMNHERYWNDCSFLYRTLRDDLHFSKQDITLLMSDGGDPGRDMLLADGSGFASSSADLDGDGERDVWLPATLPQVEATLTELAATLTANDRLFLFIVDHGAFDDGLHQAYTYMWGGQRLYDTRLAQLLDAFHVQSMSVVLEFCRSGGFVADVQRDGRVVATSCAESEMSWACRDKPYDEFVYHWTCAVAGHDPYGNAVSADADGDGHVSMSEAFAYAQQHDQREETPQYCSMPASLGEQWSFTQKQGNGIIERRLGPQSTAARKCYDLLGRMAPLPITSDREQIKRPNASQSFRRSPIIIVKP